MPSSLCDLGPCLNEYGDDLFLESALNSACSLEPLGPLLLGAIPPQSPSHPSTEDSFYPPDNTPVLSDEIWKKFDLPEDENSSEWPSADEGSCDWNALLPSGLHSALSVVLDAGKFQACTGKELRHHDCMWTGECKNKEHVRNKARPAGEQRVVAPGQTLLKNPVVPKDSPSTVPSVMMKSPSPMLTASPTVLRVPQRGGVVTRTPTGKSVLLRTSRGAGRPGEPVSARVVTVRFPEEKECRGGKKATVSSFGADGSSPRPETPLSLSEEEDEEGSTARCGAWGRGAGLRGQTAEDLEAAEAAAAFEEAIALAVEEDHDCGKAGEEDEDCGKAVSMTEVSGQVRMSGGPKAESNSCHLDHDYHMSNSNNNNNTKGAPVKTDHLGVQTPSDSEEEIDVVSWNGGDKTAAVRPSSASTAPRTNNKVAISSGRQSSGRVNLPTNPSARDKHQLQLTVQAAIAKVSATAAAGFDDDDDEEYGESEEESEEEEEEEEEEEDDEYDSSEGPQQNSNHSGGRNNGGKSSGGAKRHATSEDAGPAAKQSRSGHHHKRRRKAPRDKDPDYEGHSIPSWSYSNSYLSSSSSGTSSPPRRRGGHRKRPHRHHHEGGDSAAEDPLERRSMHNTMERQRRIDLRNAFESLRMLVPAVSEKERAAKVTILREAAGYCTQLGSQEGKQVDCINALRARQVALRAQVSSLRRSLAASR